MFSKFKSSEITKNQQLNFRGGVDPSNCKNMKGKTTEESSGSGFPIIIIPETAPKCEQEIIQN